MKKILCIGSVTTDVIVSPADSIPAPGTLRAVDSVTTHVGGCAANAAIDLGILGLPVALCCKVGADSFGSFVREAAAARGVDVRGVITDDSVSTTVSIVCVNAEGERSFLYSPGSAAAFSAGDVSDDVLADCDIVFVAGAMLLRDFDGIPCAAVMERAQKMGKFTAMDTAWDFDDLWLPKIKAVIPHLDLFMPSYEEAVKLSGETELQKITDAFFALGAKNVIIKLGKDGAHFCEETGARYTLPTYSDIKPLDTTGAGDSFCAGFLAGLALGYSFRDSGRLANAVGSHCIMAIGASAGIKPLPDILAFMERHEL